MGIRKLTKKPLSPKVQEYLETFGHLPSQEAFKFKTKEELEELADLALSRNKPVKAWAERPNLKLGTVQDKYYQ